MAVEPERDRARAVAVVFVHGILSSRAAWEPLIRYIREDADLRDFDLMPYEYASPLMQLRPGRDIPDVRKIARGLDTFLNNLPEYRRIVLIAHSQGGLVVQRYLHDALAGARGRELARIRLILLFACPNGGSEFLGTLRRSTRSFLRNPQEKDLVPLVRDVTEATRMVLERVVGATEVTETRCPIPLFVYAGLTDAIVTEAAALNVFPRVGVLPGDHSRIIRPTSSGDPIVNTVRIKLLNDLAVRPEDPDTFAPARHALARHRTTTVEAHVASGSRRTDVRSGRRPRWRLAVAALVLVVGAVAAVMFTNLGTGEGGIPETFLDDPVLVGGRHPTAPTDEGAAARTSGCRNDARPVPAPVPLGVSGGPSGQLILYRSAACGKYWAEVRTIKGTQATTLRIDIFAAGKNSSEFGRFAVPGDSENATAVGLLIAGGPGACVYAKAYFGEPVQVAETPRACG